ncbi:MAG: sigma-70 family RNA polymerase sigma factor [Planctomycetota bacterium]
MPDASDNDPAGDVPDGGDRDDAALARRLAAGDEQALGEAFSRHRDRLRRGVLFRMDPRLRGRVDADDVLQEAYLQAAQRLGHFAQKQAPLSAREEEGGGGDGDNPAEGAGGPMSVFVWLRLLVAQTLIDAHRRHLGAQMRDAGREVAIHRGPAGGNAVATSVSLAGRLLGNLTSPSQAAMRAELGAKLRDALSGMSELDQEVIALRHFEHLSNGEVAQALGIEAKAASIRYVRAIKRLKGVLDKVPGFAGLESLLR